MQSTKSGCTWQSLATVSFIVVPLIAYPIVHYATQDYATFTVDKAERVVDGNSSRYLIFTEKETFENTDSIAFFKFNSSDIYGRIDEGKTYRAKVSGIRVPFFSWYRNIIEIQEKQNN